MTIGAEGAAIDDFGRELMSREFDQLRTARMIEYWPPGAPRPAGVLSTSLRPGTWCLTFDGASAIDLPIPFFRTT